MEFWGKLGLSFMVGSAWVAVATIAADRYGSRIGGLIGGLPSTVLVSLLFIGFTQTPQVASQTTTLMPLTLGVNGLFVLVYLLLVGRGLAAGLSGGLTVWAVCAGVMAWAGDLPYGASLGGWAILVGACYLVVELGLSIPSCGATHVPCTLAQAGARALLGGAVIVGAVGTSKFLGPSYGGILAAFPATFFSTLAISYRTGGPEFSRAVGKAMMLGGTTNVALYTIAVRYLYMWCGLLIGTVVALLLSFGVAYLTYRLMETRPS